ncbi:hypothetical protein [Siphonobacter sp.]|uniref:hypothetical protein n=1 Tax=Siphonobacter sp. TaxID=1869184 RepID=UPI003B3B6842
MRFIYLGITILLVSIIWITINKYRDLASPGAYTETDHLEELLADVKKKLPKDSVIGMKMNVSPERIGMLYFESTLVLAPIVVELAESDTMLVLEEPGRPALNLAHYERMLSGSNQKFTYSVVHPKR